MNSLKNFIIICLSVVLLVSVGCIIYLYKKENKVESSTSSLIGKNKIIEKYVKDSVTHTIYQDRFISNSKNEKELAIGKTYADSLQKALKISIDKIDQVTKTNARLEAQVALITQQTPTGKTVKTHKDKYLDLTYFPETDSLKMAYDINLNDARYHDKKWFLGNKQNYINLYSDDKRVTINGVKTYRIKEAPPNRFGIGFSAGYGLGKDGNEIRLIPYIGIGFNYNLIEF